MLLKNNVVISDEYSDNGVKDWLKVQQDVALVKKSFKGNAVPSHAAGKRIIEEKYEDKILNLKSSGLTTKRQSSCTAIETKLASYRVEFPGKKRKVNNAMTVLQPLSLQEEQEQIRMATTLSMHIKKNTVSNAGRRACRQQLLGVRPQNTGNIW